MDNMYVIKDGKQLRCGYTTGSCATAAAKAAMIGLLKGMIPEHVEIDTPAGVVLKLKVDKQYIENDIASCCIVKDAGDDPDVTDGIEIFARVSRRDDNNIVIDGGEGIGRITNDGFWGKEGEAAINPVPRRMIREEVLKVLEISNDAKYSKADCTNNATMLSEVGFDILIYAPMGKEIAKKTFNPNIGIVGGISIIGTKGIVEPMSEEALKKTIFLEIDSVYARGIDKLILFPGNYGEKFAQRLGLEGGMIKTSNYLGDVLLYCQHKEIKDITIVGNIGKLCKLSIGIFNTHSKVADARTEAFIYYLALLEAPYSLILKVKAALTSEEATKILIEAGYKRVFSEMKHGCEERIRKYLKDEDLNIKVIIYSMEYGELY